MVSKKLDRNYYDLLEIERTANDDILRKAYKKAALVHHPDKGGNQETFQLVNEAWSILSDATRRSEYDRDLKKFNLKDGLPGVASRKKPSAPAK